MFSQRPGPVSDGGISLLTLTTLRMTSINPLASFRVQLALFIAALLLASTIAQYLIGQQSERQVRTMVDRHIEELTTAIDLTLQSRQSKVYLDQFIPDVSRGNLLIGPDQVVNHIIVTDSRGRIIDSTDTGEINRALPAAISELPAVSAIHSLTEIQETTALQRRITFTIEGVNDEGASDQRKIIIVFSMNRLARARRDASRNRLLSTLLLGLLMTVLVAVFSLRFTRPVTELSAAAHKVAAGELEFEVPVKRRDEVGTLARTFNEMIAGLRNKQELEEQLQRAERSAVVGRLASGIAHEIRNPLNFMNLSIDYLKNRFAPAEQPPPNAAADRAEYTRILDTIKDEIARLNTLVSNFLSYGRPAKLKMREVNLRTLIEEVMSLVQAQADQQGVGMSIVDETASARDKQVMADAEQIKTCFSNLIINAIQAMPEGGRLRVTLRADSTAEAPGVGIAIADTGCGIDAEALEQIFEPYYSTKETGIGLGLPLTRKLIEDHGGTIAVSSEPGVGTTFLVTLLQRPVVTSGLARAV
ncbi:MAG: ATP-binding protein [Blastocatellia bacterium]